MSQVIRTELLTQLRGDLRGRLAGARCLVVGSAPGAAAPDLAKIDAVICVNGSPWIARSMGIARPDLTVIAGFSTRADTDVRRASIAVLNGLSTSALLFVEAGADAQFGRQALDKAGFAYERFSAIGVNERAAIIRETCGRRLGTGPRDSRVSNGMFTVILAMWADAAEIVLAGFSLAGGHAYMSDATPRYHGEGDRRFLELVVRLGVPVTTTTPELQTAFGIGRCPQGATRDASSC